MLSEQPKPSEHRLTWWLALIQAALFIPIAMPLLTGRIVPVDDVVAFHLPLRKFYAQCLRQDESFDWIPNIFGGFYLTGEGQIGTYHPFHYLLYRFLPLDVGFSLEFLTGYVVMLVGMCFFLHRYVSTSAAMMGAMLFTFSGFNLLHMIHLNLIAGIAHLPWLLWAIDRTINAETPSRRRTGFALIALLTGSQLLVAHPQAVWFSLIAESCFAVLLLFHSNGRLKSVATLVSGKTLGFAIGAVQLIATYDLAHNSARSFQSDMYSLHPWNVLQLLCAKFFRLRVFGTNTHELGLYCGSVPIILIVWWVTARWFQIVRTNRTDSNVPAPTPTTALPNCPDAKMQRAEEESQLGSTCHLGNNPQTRRLSADRLAIAAICFSVFSLWMAFGSYGGLYKLQTYLPVVGGLRCPCRFIVLVQLGVSVAAAVAFHHLLTVDDVTGTTRLRRWVVWTPAIIAVIIAAWGSPLFPLDAFSSLRYVPLASFQTRLMTAGVFIPATFLVFVAARRRTTGVFSVLVLFAAIDQGVYGFSYYLPLETSRIDAIDLEPFTPPTNENGRIWSSNHNFNLFGNVLLLGDYSLIDGYAALPPRRHLNYDSQPSALRVAGVVWIRNSMSGEQPPGLSHTALRWMELPKMLPLTPNWQKVPNPLPRARLVTQAIPCKSPEKMIDEIDVATTALVERSIVLDDGMPGIATILADRPGRIEVAVKTSGRQLLVVNESYFPGWTVTLDGHTRRVERVYGDFMGCVVNAGEHTVKFRFAPIGLWYGKIISLSGFVAACAIAASCFWNRKRADSAKDNSGK